MEDLSFNDLTIITVGSLVSVLAGLSYDILETPILKLEKRFTRPAPYKSPQPASAPLRRAEASDA